MDGVHASGRGSPRDRETNDAGRGNIPKLATCRRFIKTQWTSILCNLSCILTLIFGFVADDVEMLMNPSRCRQLAGSLQAQTVEAEAIVALVLATGLTWVTFGARIQLSVGGLQLAGSELHALHARLPACLPAR